MTIMIHPSLFPRTERSAYLTQKAFHTSSSYKVDNRHTTKMENKPALLVVTDVDDNILLSLVGRTQWNEGAATLGASDTLAHNFMRTDTGRELTDSNTAKFTDTYPTVPRIPSLDFRPASQYAETIRNTGTATKAYLVVNYLDEYSTTVISDWPVIYWDGVTKFNAAGLGADLPYLQVSVGDMASDQALRLTRTDLDKSEHTVQMADASLKIYFKNLFHDWSGTKAELDAILAAIPGVGTSLADIEEKEQVAFPVV